MLTFNSEKYDVIVIGGGPAGSSLASLLAKKNRKVLLLEKEKFPRYHIGESLVPGVMPILEEIGAREAVESYGFKRKNGITLVWGRGQEPWAVSFDEPYTKGEGYGYAYQVVRSEFDNLLLQHAKKMGANIKEEHKVTEIIHRDGRVVGVKYQSSHNEVICEAYANYIVDATGQSALLGNYFKSIETDPQLKNIATWAYFTDVEQYEAEAAGNILTEHTAYGWVWVIPQHTGKTSIGWVASTDKYKRLLESESSIEDAYMKVLNSTVEARRRLQKAQRAQDEPLRTIRDWSYKCNKFYGPGYLLVGDAAGLVDPLFSTGVFLAMNGGTFGAKMLDFALAEPAREEEFFSRYETAYKAFLDTVTSFVHFFYDASRELEDYFGEAKVLVDPIDRMTARQDFVYLISGLAGVNLLECVDAANSQNMTLSSNFKS